MPTYRSGKSYLGEIEARLRRLLNLQGAIPVELDQRVVPVIIVGDGTQPGMTERRGRRWVAAFNGVANASVCVVQAVDSVIIDRVTLSTPAVTATAHFRLYFAGPEIASPVALTSGANAIMLSRARTTNETPPIETGAAVVAAVGFEFMRAQGGTSAAMVQLFDPPAMGMELQPGGKLLVLNNTSSSGNISIFGRIF